MYGINPITLLLFVLFLYPIFKGFLFKFSSHGLKEDVEETNKNISFVASLLSGVYLGNKIFIVHDTGLYKSIYYLLPQNIIKSLESNTLIIYAIIMPLMIFVIYKIFIMFTDILNIIIMYPLIDGMEKFLLSKKNVFKRFAGAAFQFPKALCYILFASFVLNIFSMAVSNEELNKYLETSSTYKYICKEVVIPVTNSTLAKKLPNILNESFKIVIKDSKSKGSNQDNQANSNTIVYYNGVTLEDGIKSNSSIDGFAVTLANKENTTYGKAKIIYNWIGNNISYDNDKAARVLNNDFNVSSGAIPTFDTGKGICFDYSCLYVAMCRANNIKVRLITGEGFNGVGWVSHAWNQVYIPEDGKWINVDTTFYKGGNYFNSIRFNIDHKADQIAGEW